MFSCHVLVAGSLFVLLVVQSSSAGEAPQNQPAKPRTVSSQVRDACDVAYAVTAKIPGVSIRRSTGTFGDEALAEPVFGCGLAISGFFTLARETGDAGVRLRELFSDQGWQELLEYGADGKDGTSFAFRKGGVACLVRGSWNGGADGEPEIPAGDWYNVAVVCTSPEFLEHRRP